MPGWAGAAVLLLVSVTGSAAWAGHGGVDVVPTLAPDRVARLIAAGEPVVFIDLRPVEAYRQAHVRGARSVPRRDLGWRLGDVPRDGQVVLYSDSDRETSEAYAFLWERGYRNVAVLADGLAGWVQRRLPTGPVR